MKCLYPVHSQRQINGVLRAFARRCGQCMSCRITRAQEKAARIRLESVRYPAGSCWFVTLTYSDGAVPLSPSGIPTVSQADWIAFRLALNRRLRLLGFSVEEWSWAMVLEYGERTHRPHAHVVLMGVDPARVRYVEEDREWRERYDAQQRKLMKRGTGVPESLQPLHRLLLAAWRHRGHVHLVPYDEGAASYVAHYVTKGMTRGHLAEGDDREPERFSWSLGHGSHIVPELAERFRRHKLYFVNHPAHRQAEDWLPVPEQKVFLQGGRKFVLDAYMRAKLVEALGGDVRSEDERWAWIEAEYSARFAQVDEGLAVVDLLSEEEEDVELERLRTRVRRRQAKARGGRSL